MAKIRILVGTMTGTALAVGEALAEQLNLLGHPTLIDEQPTAEIILSHPDEVLLHCTSNTGSGNLPDNLVPFYLELTRNYPAIAGRRYGVVNLGDSVYLSFNEAGRAFDLAFEDLGAIRLGEPLVLDASEGEDPEALALAWLDDWVKTL